MNIRTLWNQFWTKKVISLTKEESIFIRKWLAGTLNDYERVMDPTEAEFMYSICRKLRKQEKQI